MGDTSVARPPPQGEDEPGKPLRGHSRGDGLSSPWGGRPEWGDRHAGVPIRLSFPDKPMEQQLIEINAYRYRHCKAIDSSP